MRAEGRRRARQVHRADLRGPPQGRWQALAAERGEADADGFWRAALQRGGVFDEPRGAGAGRARRAARDGRATPSPRSRATASSSSRLPALPCCYDGRGANKPWLLENADPVTKITWHSWVEVQPETARRSTSATARSSGSPRRTGRSRRRPTSIPAFTRDVRRDAARLRPHRVRGLRQGPRASTRSTCSARPAGDVRALSLDPGHGREDRRLPEARHASRAYPRQLGRGIAEAMPLAAAQKGLTLKEAYLERGPRRARGQHRARGRGAQGLERGSSIETTQPRRLRAASIPQWGMAIDLAALHRLLGLRHRLLRGEQHPDGRRARRSSAAAR